MTRTQKEREEQLRARRARLHMERTSFTEFVLPAILIALAVLTLALTVIALSILIGITPWR